MDYYKIVENARKNGTLSEDDIIKCAYKFFFDDEDAEDGKIWRYMQAVR